MKKILIFTIMISCLCMYSYADYYITYEKSSGEVVDISKDTSCAMPKDQYAKTKVKGDIKELKLLYSPSFHKFKNGKLELNNKKIQDDFKAKQELANKQQEELMIQDRMRKIAVDSLEAEGYIFQFINVEE